MVIDICELRWSDNLRNLQRVLQIAKTESRHCMDYRIPSLEPVPVVFEEHLYDPEPEICFTRDRRSGIRWRWYDVVWRQDHIHFVFGFVSEKLG
jgi:hypothetical protein